MGILDLPRKLIHNYFRFVGLIFLIVYSLWLRFWDNIQPTIRPVRDVYENVNHKGVTLAGILEQCVKVRVLEVVLMVGILYYKFVSAVWETVSRPFRPQVQFVKKFLEEVESDYRKVTPKDSYGQ